ncbi:hypothetical protein QBC47DRAFT_187742 [Echria macrotheca]|uniref:Uncharacterized protein n=1 Tax=Echria macrotheca TaxID=438768 RepID=A0AAJ0FCK1_9PEZI|nr:hypothetical protein QBC47DRAFT_187742 [Echria macrotheca]
MNFLAIILTIIASLSGALSSPAAKPGSIPIKRDGSSNDTSDWTQVGGDPGYGKLNLPCGGVPDCKAMCSEFHFACWKCKEEGCFCRMGDC